MSKQRGFTLIETLIVMAIISVLAAIIFTVLGPVRESARQRSCASNLHQIGLAVAMYVADYDGQEPIKGASLTFPQVGLPLTDKNFHHFLTNYLKRKPDAHSNNTHPLACPSWNREIPYPLGYLFILATGDYEDVDVNKILSERGPDFPLVECDNHNVTQNWDELPRWEKKRVLVLRFSQKVDTRLLPPNDGDPWRR